VTYEISQVNCEHPIQPALRSVSALRPPAPRSAPAPRYSRAVAVSPSSCGADAELQQSRGMREPHHGAAHSEQSAGLAELTPAASIARTVSVAP